MLYEAQAHVAASHPALARLDATLHLLDVVGCVVANSRAQRFAHICSTGLSSGALGGRDSTRSRCVWSVMYARTSLLRWAARRSQITDTRFQFM